MPLPTPARFCFICGDKLQGRKDKIFCSNSCKQTYHRSRRNEIQPFAQTIDKILHRNWVILSEYFDQIGKRKFYVSKSDLNKAGFHERYYTTSQKNSKNKMYYYVYNFGWMNFNEKQMMIIKLVKPK